MKSRKGSSEKGQMAVLVAFMMVGLLVTTGLAIDGGTAFLERRRMQNAADAAALAGGQQLVRYRNGNTTVSDQDVAKAVNDLAERNGVKDTDGTPGNDVNDNVSAVYIDEDGNEIGTVGNSSLPPAATGVRVNVEIERPTRFMQLAGMPRVGASAKSAAQTGLFPGGVGGPESGDDGPRHALSYVQFEPVCGEDCSCTVTQPEPDDDDEEEGEIEITRSNGISVTYGFENKGYLIKFENAQIDGEDAGLGEDGACDSDPFTITVACPSDKSLEGFNLETKAAGSKDTVWASVGVPEARDGVKMAKTGFFIQPVNSDSDEDGNDSYSFTVYAGLCAMQQSEGIESFTTND